MDRTATLNVRPLVIADLKAHPRNYNRHQEGQIGELIRSIRRHGPYKNAVVSADGYILAGHGILEAARRDGWTEWPCEVRPYNHDHPDALNLIVTDNEVGNPANELGPDPDRELLAALLKDVEASTGLAGTGYDDKALAALLAETQAETTDWPELATGDRSPFQQMTFTVSDEQAEVVVEALRAAKAAGPFVDTSNENGNGNALARVCEAYRG